MHKFFDQYKNPLVKEINLAVNKDLAKWNKQYPWAKDALERLGETVINGKLIRGLLVILAASPKNKSAQSDAARIGAAIELIHSGMLIHDDIMDRDMFRRGMPAIFTQYKKISTVKDESEKLHYGESMATCVGIAACFLAMRQFAEIKNPKVAQGLNNLFGEEMTILGFAQMDDVDTSTHHEKMNRKSVLRMYEQKTGRYTFGVPLLAGFMLNGTYTKKVESLVSKLSVILGVIFQLQDDVLGVFGKSAVSGKSTGGDIRERKQTWLYFKTLDVADIKDAKKLKQLYASKKPLTKVEQKWVLECMEKNNIKQLAEKELRKFQVKALVLTKNLPLPKNGLEALESLIDFLVTRNK